MLTSRPLKLDKWRTKLFFLPHTCTIDFYFELRMGVRDTVIIFLEHGPCKRSVYVSPPSPLLKSLTFHFYCIFLLLLFSFRRFSSSKILMGISIRKAWKSGRLAVVVGEGRRAWSLPLPLASFLPCFPHIPDNSNPGAPTPRVPFYFSHSVSLRSFSHHRSPLGCGWDICEPSKVCCGLMVSRGWIHSPKPFFPHSLRVFVIC